MKGKTMFTYEKIKKSARISYAESEDSYDLVFRVGEIEYKFGIVNGEDIDILRMDGTDFSPDVVYEIYYKIDDEITSLSDLFNRIDVDTYYLVSDWLKADGQEDDDERRMRAELSSPYLTGRI